MNNLPGIKISGSVKIFCYLTAYLLIASVVVAQTPDVEHEGQRLAKQYCVACHVFPEPDVLTKKSWRFALTYMGIFMGIRDKSLMEDAEPWAKDSINLREEFLDTAKLIPRQPLLRPEQWKVLQDWYLENAPEIALPQQTKPEIIEDTELFIERENRYNIAPALTTMVYIDEQKDLTLVHDGIRSTLSVLDNEGNYIETHPSRGVSLVDAISADREFYLLNIGDLFASNIGVGTGDLQRVRVVGDLFISLDVMIEDLQRPAGFDLQDIDMDGNVDAVIANFGDYTGSLRVYWGIEGENFNQEPQYLNYEPGGIRATVHDFNGDGLPDIAALMSHALESLSIYINQGDRKFKRKFIFKAPSSFGYTGMVLRDFDADGQVDILTINGDNGDSDPYNTLKHSHGIRIYNNLGDLEFEEAYFYPFYGGFGAEVEDFDLDGDLDIAAIAFHPDFSKRDKPENFVLLKQDAPFSFLPTTHPATYFGRLMTMDSGDLDDDGDKDIIIGAGYAPIGMRGEHDDLYEQWVEKGPSLIYLINQTIP